MDWFVWGLVVFGWLLIAKAVGKSASTPQGRLRWLELWNTINKR